MNRFAEPFPLDSPRIELHVDDRNPGASRMADALREFCHPDPNLVIVIGGDGYMLKIIRREFNRQLPFFGINAGHRGFLLNDPQLLGDPIKLPQAILLDSLPLLEVHMIREDGSEVVEHAFNDAWVERATTQTAWVEVSVNDKIMFPKLIGDGILLATPAGSTAYAMTMGGHPLPRDARALTLVGSNIADPVRWKMANLPDTASVTFTCLDCTKRPAYGVVDGKNFGKVQSMSIAKSAKCRAKLGFIHEQTLEQKLIEIQFPQQ